MKTLALEYTDLALDLALIAHTLTAFEALNVLLVFPKKTVHIFWARTLDRCCN